MSTPSPRFSGVVPPTVTPLLEGGGVDVASLERLLERQLEAGVHGIFALGSSGETVFLSDAERGRRINAPMMFGILALFLINRSFWRRPAIWKASR